MAILWVMVISYAIGAFPLNMILFSKGFHRRLHHSFLPIGLDIGTGALASLLGLMMAGWTGASLAALSVVLGRVYPIFTGFQGEYGVGVAAGALLILSPLLMLMGVSIFLVILLLTRYPSVSIVFTIVLVMLLTLFFFPEFYVTWVVFCVGGLILYQYKGSANPWHSLRGWGRRK
ncbi:glycerol-3-phosphate acyltransferase [Kroppenstedtia pulmonis]|uniref:Glycerol-3-phosphate acyltransferase n=1 Tax=Kroppenstedtia pulmonis TaxID=1380685 RepID=A0A7D3XHC4_9BACL|nr:glycerol-3-phosphate acyltransferase [Kroppenstedtia pulmonis]QKG83504.1 glycerol-3-phosphate acyltransferase [Kroppenstedtia pulmonis]